MSMTAKDARTKWCPFVRIMSGAGLIETTINRIGSEAHPHCIVSDCMAWRWSYNPEEAQGNVNGPSGYCGLAGPVQ